MTKNPFVYARKDEGLSRIVAMVETFHTNQILARRVPVTHLADGDSEAAILEAFGYTDEVAE